MYIVYNYWTTSYPSSLTCTYCTTTEPRVTIAVWHVRTGQLLNHVLPYQFDMYICTTTERHVTIAVWHVHTVQLLKHVEVLQYQSDMNILYNYWTTCYQSSLTCTYCTNTKPRVTIAVWHVHTVQILNHVLPEQSDMYILYKYWTTCYHCSLTCTYCTTTEPCVTIAVCHVHTV